MKTVIPKNILWQKAFREWRLDVVRRQEALARLIEGREFRAVVRDFDCKAGKGRQRALRRLRLALGPYATFQLHENGRALWFAIGFDEKAFAASVDCVAISGGVSHELSRRKARGRACEEFIKRNPPGTDLGQALIAANIALGRNRVHRLEDGRRVLVEAGAGGFLGELIERPGADKFFYAVIWCSKDMRMPNEPGLVAAAMPEYA